MKILRVKEWLKQKEEIQFEVDLRESKNNIVTVVCRLSDDMMFYIGQLPYTKTIEGSIMRFYDDLIHVQVSFRNNLTNECAVITCPINDLVMKSDKYELRSIQQFFDI